MNPVIFTIILIPIIEIYLFIKIGSQIGAFNTICLTFISAIIGIYYAKYEGLNTLKLFLGKLLKHEISAYEIVSGATITFASILLIIPGFATDILGILLIFPVSRKFILKKLSKRFIRNQKEKNNFIDGEFEDIEENDDGKI